MELIIAQSERLRIRHFSKNDAPFLLKLLNSPEWVEMLGNYNVDTIKDAEHYLKHHILKDYSTHQYGFYAVELKQENQPIGLCGVTLRKDQTIPDLGFGILPEYAGKGMAKEAASLILEHLRKKGHFQTIDAFSTIPNIKSQHLLSKLGFVFKVEIYHPAFQAWVKHYQLEL